MTITTYQIQNVLRTYGRQLSRRDTLSRVARLGTAEEAGGGRSPMSAEAKRQEVIGRITREIVTRIAQDPQSGRRAEGEEQSAFEKLAAEYGQPLTMSLEGGIETFRVVDEQGGKLVTLPEAESEKLRQRLYELTRDIVDQNMVKA